MRRNHMIPYQKEKFDNAVCFFASEHTRRTGRPTYQTYIYKYLALFDFAVLENTGKPALDIDYEAYKRGPVPEIYDRRRIYNTECFEFVKIISQEPDEKYIVAAKKDPDMEYFSSYEIEIMKALVDKFAIPGTTTDPIIEATHEIKAWEKAWEKRGIRKKVKMQYEDNFIDLNAKSEEELTPEEETFLVYKALKKGFA